MLFKKAGIQINKKLVHLLTGKNDVPNYTQKFGETATNFLITTPLLDESAKEQIVALFKKQSLIEQRKICLDLNEKLK